VETEGVDAELARRLLQGGMWNWKQLSDYRAVRERVKGLTSRADTMARVEIGNANAGSYEVVWVIRLDHGVRVFADRQGDLEEVSLPLSAWDRLRGTFDKSDVWSLRSSANLGVDDASTFYFSLCDHGRVAQFAVYGLPMATQLAEGERTFAQSVARHRMVIEAVLNTVRSPE
jgi:hypothetical protein